MKEKIVLVTGATRGIGKGIALALAKKGAIVYFTGRTEQEYSGAVNLSGSLSTTQREIEDAGAIAFGVKCDHINDDETKAVVDKIIAEQGRIDVLVNNVWGGYEYFNDGTEFWKEDGFWMAPISRFDKMFSAGVRAHYVTSSFVVPHMIKNNGGLIVNLSFWAAQKDDLGVGYGMAKAATNKMTETMAHDLCQHNINVITIYPGLVRTESVIKAAEHFDLSNSESPEFIGMGIAALASDINISDKTGTIQIAAQIALDYGYKDIDGKQPKPLTLNDIH